jgi:antitoxin (DNA-binding transcriptional repressor) of toxin-antitoxin stability system
MTIVTTVEAQANLGQLIASLAQGEEVLITDGGLPVAQLVRPNVPQAIARAQTPTTTAKQGQDEDDERPWRGVLAIESPGQAYPCGKLHLPPEPLPPTREPVDILWDRMSRSDD